MSEFLDEYQSIVDEICEKYNYSVVDTDKNDSLRTVLLKIIPAMLQNTNLEDRKLFYSMLTHTPIVITENLNKEGLNELINQYIGNTNPHIEEETSLNTDEYGKNIGAGAYISEPILDENLQLKGKKSFIYIQKISGKAKDFLGTDINVSHLIHELGHAWHSEKEEYSMQDEKTLKHRVGTSEAIHTFSKSDNGKFIEKRESVTGLMLEEGMNTVAEEKALLYYTGLSMEELKNVYKETLVPSRYQGSISSLVSYMLENLHTDDFEKWRLYGDLESKSKINSLMCETQCWQNREEYISSSSNSKSIYNKKRAIISRISSKRVQDFFEEYETTYFSDISQMTPLEKIDNVLFQYYNFGMTKYSIEIDDYGDFLKCLAQESYILINQSIDLMKNKELNDVVETVRLDELNQITKETKTLTKENNKNLDLQSEEIGENR